MVRLCCFLDASHHITYLSFRASDLFHSLAHCFFSVQKKLVSSTAYYPSQVRYDSVLAFRDRLQMILTRENSGLHCKREHRHISGRS